MRGGGTRKKKPLRKTNVSFSPFSRTSMSENDKKAWDTIFRGGLWVINGRRKIPKLVAKKQSIRGAEVCSTERMEKAAKSRRGVDLGDMGYGRRFRATLLLYCFGCGTGNPFRFGPNCAKRCRRGQPGLPAFQRPFRAQRGG